MQQTLKIEVSKETVISNPFDFETMCLINDVHASGKKMGYLSMCREGVSHMFEGTKATEDVLQKLSAAKMTALCTKVWQFYLDTLEEASKNA